MKLTITKITLLSVIYSVFCIFGLQNAHAQRKAPDANGFPLADLAHEALDEFYSMPEGFRFLNVIKWPTIHKNTYGGMLSFSFESEDSQCRLYWPVLATTFFPYDPGDLPENRLLGYRSPFYDDVNLSHRNLIWSELTRIMETDDIDFNDYVTVVAGREARKRFRADSIFIYNVPRFVPIGEDEAQFEYCTRMIIIRKDRGGFLPFVWLFTSEGEKNKQEYIRKLDGRVWYNRKKIRERSKQGTRMFRYIDEWQKYQQRP